MKKEQPDKLKERLAVIEEFRAEFPDEESCREWLIQQLKKSNSISCPRCRAPIPEEASTRNVICGTCNKRWSITADSYFCNTRNFRVAVAAIWSVVRGLNLPGSVIAMLGNASTSTGWLNKKKVDLIAMENMDDDSLEIETALCASVFSRRSLETPAHEHPIQEQRLVNEQIKSSNTNEGNSDNKSKEPTYGSTATPLTPNETAILSILDNGTMRSDDICDRSGIPTLEVNSLLTMMELNGMVKRLNGDSYVRCSNATTASTSSCGPGELSDDAYMLLNSDLKTIKDSSGGGISRKYLGCYLAGVSWARKNVQARGKLLLKFCSQMESITLTAIQDYVSPPVVLVGR